MELKVMVRSVLGVLLRHSVAAPSPRSRGPSTRAQEGRGEGASPQAQTGGQMRRARNFQYAKPFSAALAATLTLSITTSRADGEADFLAGKSKSCAGCLLE